MWASILSVAENVVSAPKAAAERPPRTSPTSLLPAYMLKFSGTGISPANKALLENELDRQSVAPAPPRTRAQTDWAAPYNKTRMDTVIRAWQLTPPEAQTDKALADLCVAHGVPATTVKRRFDQVDPYAVPKRGPKYLGGLSREDHSDIVASIAARDHFNKARSPSANIEAIQKSVLPNFTTKQVANTYHRSIKKAGNTLGTVDSQATTKDRSGAVTEANQRHYYDTVEAAWAYARRNSPDERAPDGSILRRADVEADFVCNLDESNAIGNLAPKKVVVDKRKKGGHSQNTGTSRVSITTVHTGFASGAICSSMYLMTGAEIPPSLEPLFGSSTWLEAQGAPPGSFCVMTETAFMTDKIWDKAAPLLASNIRSMPAVKDHPNWWVVLHLDGFKSHVMTARVRHSPSALPRLTAHNKLTSHRRNKCSMMPKFLW